jgi:hypothetical protein
LPTWALPVQPTTSNRPLRQPANVSLSSESEERICGKYVGGYSLMNLTREFYYARHTSWLRAQFFDINQVA